MSDPSGEELKQKVYDDLLEALGAPSRPQRESIGSVLDEFVQVTIAEGLSRRRLARSRNRVNLATKPGDFIELTDTMIRYDKMSLDAVISCLQGFPRTEIPLEEFDERALEVEQRPKPLSSIKIHNDSEIPRGDSV